MNHSKNTLALALAGVIGGDNILMPATAHAILADGSWALTILPTPVASTTGGYTRYDIGNDGNWNSSFTYASLPGSSSFPMTDNGMLVSGTGSSIAGDGFAGIIELNVSGGAFSVPGTGMSGMVDAMGNMSLDPTGRLGTYEAFLSVTGLPLYIDDADCDTNGCTATGNTAWTELTTGSASSV